jgi:metal-dependent amidase/aminoacylase/carboxypeptidase family protein
VADRVEMDGALRCSNLELRRHLRTKIEQLVTGITEAYGASYEIEYIDYLHPIVNSPELADLVYEAIAATLGPGKVRWLEHPRMSGDSFFHYSERVPCVYAQLGSGNSELRTNYPPHHPLFDIDESCMASGVAAYCAIVLRFLASKER